MNNTTFYSRALLWIGAYTLILPIQSVSAQLQTVGKRYSSNQQISINKVDHTAFGSLLNSYVDVDGQVNYSAWKASSDDRRKLQEYINRLSSANPNLSATNEATLAFWINAYNAITLEGILDVYPTTSIRNHTKKLGYDIWHDLEFIVGDQKINLNDIEHKVLRKMNEPRIHFAIVCASIGCPRLLSQAYTASKLEEQLVANAKDFFARSRNLKFDAQRKELQISAIVKWFAADFGADRTAQVKAIAPYFPEKFKSVVRQGGYSVTFQDYDWNLNSQ